MSALRFLPVVQGALTRLLTPGPPLAELRPPP